MENLYVSKVMEQENLLRYSKTPISNQYSLVAPQPSDKVHLTRIESKLRAFQ